MAFVEIGVGTAMLYGAGIGAGAGALYSGVTGGNVLNGALMGGGLGALGGAGAAGLAGASFGGAAADMVAADVASMTASGLAPEQIAATLQSSYGMSASEAAAAAGSGSASAGTAVQAAGAANSASKLGAAPVTSAGNAPSYQSAMSELATAPTASGGLSPYSQALGSGTQTTASNLGDYWNAIGQSGNTPVTSDAVTQALQAGAQGPATGGGIGGVFSGIGNFVKEHPYLTAAGAGAALLASRGSNAFQPNYLPAYTPQSAASMGLGRTLSANYRPSRPMAKGGIASLADGGLLQSGPAQVNFMGNDMYPQSQIHRSYYATPTQMPTSAQQTAASYEPKTNPLTGELTENMAAGGITAAGETGLQPMQQQMSPQYIQQLASQFGTTPQVAQQGIQALKTITGKAGGGSVGNKYNLGSYSDGGRLLKGPGDGMSDNIPASIADKQPARLADGEFVVPADVVSHLGNGSTDAGAKHLYKMMDNVRKARTGRKSQGKQIKADKYLPK